MPYYNRDPKRDQKFDDPPYGGYIGILDKSKLLSKVRVQVQVLGLYPKGPSKYPIIKTLGFWS